jgi:hypothetical protein
MLNYLTGNIPKKSKSGYQFQMLHSFTKRKGESEILLGKHPIKKPVIVEKSDLSPMQDLKENRFLMPNTLKTAQLIQLLRNKIGITSTEAIYLFVGNSIIPPLNDTIEQLYTKYADKDGFLYITYSSENCFG